MVLVSLRLLQLLDAKVKLSNLLLQLRNLLLSDRALVQALNRRDNSHLRLKNPKIAFFCFPETKSFQLPVIIWAVMNELGKFMGCRKRTSPLGPVPDGCLWTPSCKHLAGAVTHLNAALTDINASIMEFNGLCNAQKPNV